VSHGFGGGFGRYCQFGLWRDDRRLGLRGWLCRDRVRMSRTWDMVVMMIMVPRARLFRWRGYRSAVLVVFERRDAKGSRGSAIMRMMVVMVVMVVMMVRVSLGTLFPGGSSARAIIIARTIWRILELLPLLLLCRIASSSGRRSVVRLLALRHACVREWHGAGGDGARHADGADTAANPGKHAPKLALDAGLGGRSRLLRLRSLHGLWQRGDPPLTADVLYGQQVALETAGAGRLLTRSAPVWIERRPSAIGNSRGRRTLFAWSRSVLRLLGGLLPRMRWDHGGSFRRGIRRRGTRVLWRWRMGHGRESLGGRRLIRGAVRRVRRIGGRVAWVIPVVHGRSVGRLVPLVRWARPVVLPATISAVAIIHMAIGRRLLVSRWLAVAHFVRRNVVAAARVAAGIGSFPLLAFSFQLTMPLALCPISVIERIRSEASPFLVVIHRGRRSAVVISSSVRLVLGRRRRPAHVHGPGRAGVCFRLATRPRRRTDGRATGFATKVCRGRRVARVVGLRGPVSLDFGRGRVLAMRR
jgi:hypothetical protein